MAGQSTEKIYDPKFFAKITEVSAASAAVVVPLILKLFPETQSVADVGCGTGTWLRAFLDGGVPTVRGFDDGGMDLRQLLIPVSAFRRTDLAKPPADPSERFDLAISLEVAEHLPPESAEPFIDFLTRLSDRVVFSAATPMQGGRNHINERPASYWKGLFEARGYDVFDPLRGRIWNDDRVAVYYRQNVLVAVKRGFAPDGLRPVRDGDLIDVVHPEAYVKARRKLHERSSLWNYLRAHARLR